MPSTTRRRFLAASVASAGLAGCLSVSNPTSELDTVDGQWPMDGGGAGHQRRVGDGPAEPSTVWDEELDGVRAAGPPALAGGRLYVPADAVTDESRHRHRLYALSAASGETRWQVPLRIDLQGTPAVSDAAADDRVVVTGKRSLERGRVVCFDARYGEEAWLYDVDARLTAPPTVSDDTAYVPDWSGTVHALSLADGSVRWSRKVKGDGGRTFTEAAAVHDGTLYLGSQSGTTGVVALDAETGTEEWRRSTPAVTGGPVVDDGLVVVKSHSLVTAFGTDGSERWSFNAVERDSRPVAVGDERVYVPAQERLYAIGRGGEEAWRDETEGRVGTPTVAGNRVFLRGEDELRALRTEDGSEVWSVSQGGTGEAVVAPGAVFLSDGSRVVALGG